MWEIEAGTHWSLCHGDASGLEQFQDIRRMLRSYLNNIGLQMLTQRQRQIEGAGHPYRREAKRRGEPEECSVELPDGRLFESYR